MSDFEELQAYLRVSEESTLKFYEDIQKPSLKTIIFEVSKYEGQVPTPEIIARRIRVRIAEKNNNLNQSGNNVKQRKPRSNISSEGSNEINRF
jgi:hypothetical protein